MGTTPVDWKLYADPVFRHKLANTHKPSDINGSHYDCIYFAGGHGVVYDFLDNKELHDIAKQIYEKGGIVSGVCHGVVALINLKLSTG
jgi:putative intracellular protease/amidase